MTSDGPRLRLGIVAIVSVSLFAALFARLWYLQVLEAPELALAAEANQQREIIEPAPRGRILDVNGIVLVDNRTTLEVSLDRRVLTELDEGERDDLLERLTVELASVAEPPTIESLETLLASDRFSPYTPVPVAEDVPEDVAVYLTEHQDDFYGGVRVDQRAVRTYPMGTLAAHVLGYVGAINDEEFAARLDDPLLYQLTDEIGKGGVERAYEQYLRGEPGRRVIEVDRRGNTISTLSYEPPVAGHDVYLTIDATLQAIAETALREELEAAQGRSVGGGNESNVAQAGSTVVTDPTTGAVVAMASFPTFNASTFTDGIDDVEWAALTGEGSFSPLINRAVEGQYAPGSTFKPFTAYGALTVGALAPETIVNDEGTFTLGDCRGRCTFRNAGSARYGAVDLRRSLAVSSDVYYYDIGARLWNERTTFGESPIQDAAITFGFGATTGIELPELDGRIPTPAIRAQQVGENPEVYGRWQTGDNLNTAIGQGEVAVTPLQLANAYATIANGGQLLEPRVVDRVQRAGTEPAAGPEAVVLDVESVVRAEVALPPNIRQPIVDGLAGSTVDGPLGVGTSASTFSSFPVTFPVAGKTGTAQVTGKADTALFAAFAPVGAPRYAAVAILEESGFGGRAAAPVVARILAPIADPALLPTLEPGGVLSAPLAAAVDSGDVTD